MFTLPPSGEGVLDSANVALVEPPATLTFAGTATSAGSPLARLMRAPPAGAAAESETVPTDELPATMLAGASVTELSAAATGGGGGVPRAVTVSVALRVFPLKLAANVALPSTTGTEVVTVNVAVFEPALIVTVGGALARAASLE